MWCWCSDEIYHLQQTIRLSRSLRARYRTISMVSITWPESPQFFFYLNPANLKSLWLQLSPFWGIPQHGPERDRHEPGPVPAAALPRVQPHASLHAGGCQHPPQKVCRLFLQLSPWTLSLNTCLVATVVTPAPHPAPPFTMMTSLIGSVSDLVTLLLKTVLEQNDPTVVVILNIFW